MYKGLQAVQKVPLPGLCIACLLRMELKGQLWGPEKSVRALKSSYFSLESLQKTFSEQF